MKIYKEILIDNFRLTYFQNGILEWFKENKRVFPWRASNLTNYQIIISEILLQRTKAETVSKFYNHFINDFPNWLSLANANTELIAEYLRPIGLYNQRAKRLHKLAIYMVENNEILPSKRELIDEIPFMGQYIANAVELLIYKRNMPLLDVNMARVLERFFGKRTLADIRYDPYLQNLAKQIVEIEDSKTINWAILDFAAIICKSQNPLCLSCPINFKCIYFNINML